MSTRRNRKRYKAPALHAIRVIQLLIIVICIGGLYLLWMDTWIQREFEGKKWTVPARVYASSLELYPGLALTTADLRDHLNLLGYVPDATPRSSGQYSERKDALEVSTRPVVYWTGEEAGKTLRIEFQDGRINQMTDLKSGTPVNVIRLEPELIGKIYPRHNEDRILLAADEIPEILIHALLAMEDRRFFTHHGLDARGMLRALYANIRQARVTQGGSTITQQLVKNFFLNRERTLWRKFNEMTMALLLENHYSKMEILAAYCNEIYLGQHGARAIHGFGTAAEFYYGRPLHELRPDQVALLVALVRGAAYYDPRKHPDRARGRRDLVLATMHEQGVLSQADAASARAASLDVITRPSWTSAKYPAFLDLVRRQLLRDYSMTDLQEEGLRIFTTLDTAIHRQAQHHAGEKLAELQRMADAKNGPLQMAAVIVRTGTGDILSLIGGSDENLGEFNRALEARRPIGSLIKPFIYLAALSAPERWHFLSPLEDQPLTLKLKNGVIWSPDNYDNTSHGTVFLYEALQHSYNQATVRLGLQVGIDKIIATLRQAGINRDIADYPSLLLGALEMTPLEVAQLYQTIANGGFQAPLNSISAVLDRDNVPLRRYGLKVKQALDPAPVFLVSQILASVVNGGTARALKAGFGDRLPLAGKTGTTNDLRDSWFVGFGDNLLAAAWLGYDNNRPTPFTGATGALQLWAAMLRDAGIQPVNFIAPEDIKWLTRQGGLFTGDCPDLPRLPYISSHEPSNSAGCYTGRVE